MSMECGSPVSTSRPEIVMVSGSLTTSAFAIRRLISSAVCSPIYIFFWMRTFSRISCVILFPAVLIEVEHTISPRESTAISLVPPPISSTIFPLALPISSPAPSAAILGSSSRYTFFAPARYAQSRIAFFSTEVIFVGWHIKITFFLNMPFRSHFFRK